MCVSTSHTCLVFMERSDAPELVLWQLPSGVCWEPNTDLLQDQLVLSLTLRHLSGPQHKVNGWKFTKVALFSFSFSNTK